jgi:GMP synthase (glutamine-hydrolysing)
MPVVAVIHNLAEPFLGHVEAPLRDVGLELDERRPAAGEELPDVEAVDGIVVLGGEASAAGDAPGFDDQLELLRAAVDRGVPVLGVCLGGQLLARALGGEVRHARRSAQWRDLDPLPAAIEDPVFAPLAPPVPALHFNEDVFEPPPGAVELLSRGGEGAEAFRYGEAAWGVQFHPDVDDRAMDRWLESFAPYIAEAGVDAGALRAESERRMAAQERTSRALFAAFARVVAGRAAA